MQVELKLSRTAPKPTYVGSKVFTDPTSLVLAVKRTNLFCHYFDMAGNEIKSLDAALELLGVDKGDMANFKANHGLFNTARTQEFEKWNVIIKISTNAILILVLIGVALPVFSPDVVLWAIWEILFVAALFVGSLGAYKNMQFGRLVVWTTILAFNIIYIVSVLKK